ncbi:MAG: ABC transporter permease [Inquilinus sp.]|uniref:ABC transporter permease n=1 Tax=Inquilinus sp. TaxID=1932117 RepID=UPI003F30A73F
MTDAVGLPPAPSRYRLAPAIPALGLWIDLAFVVFLVICALTPQIFATHDPLAILVREKLQPPGPAHWFGTDHLGRDVYSRLVYGTGNSLLATFIAVAIGLVAGSLLGLVSGTAPKSADAAIMRVVDVMLAIPNLLLSLAIVTALGFGLVPVAIAVGIGSIGSFARLMRAEVLRVKGLTFVESTELLGASKAYVILRHILPHAVGPVLALATIEFGTAVLSVSSLSFLGFGAPPPAMEWGLLIAEGRKFINVGWWLILFPSVVIVATVLTTNHLGHALEKRHGRTL